MDVRELYAQIGGDYEEALGRLRSEALIGKFVVKFPGDASCSDLVAAWAAHDEAAAFDAAHKAKGVCGNLSLTSLARLASEVTEALRPGNETLRAETDVDALVAELDAEHRKTVVAIAAYAAG